MQRLAIDGTTLLAQLGQLGAIGIDAMGARTRLAASESDKHGRDQLVAWMHDIGLEVRIDAIGNIYGILPGRDRTAAPLMLGSHIDTVINAGMYDGCYGVLAGLAVQRALCQTGIVPACDVVVVAFTNEEGVRYQPDMLGSLVVAGGMPVADALDVIGTDGTRLGDELARIGYAGDMQPGSIVPSAYIELHVEQGPMLEHADVLIGAVAHLQGISWQQLTITGQANHAGTTPMTMRHDAGVAAAGITVALHQYALASGTTRATVGSMQVSPNAINVIPQQVVMTVDIRDPDDARVDAAEAHLREVMDAMCATHGVDITAERLVRFPAVTFDADLVARITQAATQRGLSCMPMISGAGHDAQMMARIAPTAMIFVPSRGGISHNPAEYTSDAQLIAGAQVLCDVVQTFI
ncbi:MAG: Zn-dependent hydrolase [Roseiflexaceae bacterium]|jgi:N-carbamoyl-L-amino-acid hydrolase|nr:Zn-dependent hydrolase [Chloroflexaceae bacterium]